MSKRSVSLLLTVVAALAFNGCAGLTEAEGVFVVNGRMTTEADDSSGEVFAIWWVTSGQGEYTYKHGQGEYDDEEFSLGFPSNPPPEAMNRYDSGAQFGVALLATVAPDGSMPGDGQLTKAQDDDAWSQPFSARHAVIYREGPTEATHWSAKFPEGFSCGRCAFKSQGFDGYEPVDCSEVTFTSSDAEVCNWT